MDMERAEDFRTLRAKFQNESKFSSALLQPSKKPLGEISPQQQHCLSSAPSPEPKTLCRVQPPLTTPQQHPEYKAVPSAKPRSPHLLQGSDHEQNTTNVGSSSAQLQLNSTSQKPEITPFKPVVLPRAKLRELPETGKNNDKKATEIPKTPCKRTTHVAHSQKPWPTSCGFPKETGLADDSFRNTLRIWESTTTLQRDQMPPTAPPQCPNRTTSLIQLSSSNSDTVGVEEKAKTSANAQALALATPQKLSQKDLAAFPTPFPPLPPRGHTASQKLVPESADFSSTMNGTDRQSKTLPYLNERQQDPEEIKLPKTKPLPSIISLGPPPKKPARPPKVDLNCFYQNLPGMCLFEEATDDAYVTPEIVDDLNMYEESMLYLTHSENSINSDQELAYPPKTGKGEDIKKQNLLIATPRNMNEQLGLHNLLSVEKEATKERGPLKQAKEIAKISSHAGFYIIPKINGECRGEKYPFQEETTLSFPEEGVAKDGNFSDGYVSLETMTKKGDHASLDSSSSKCVQSVEEMYDDVEGIQRDLQACDVHNSFASEAFAADAYEETYEDIQSESYGSSRIEDLKVEKLKGFGKLFKKGKFKIKTAYLKDNVRSLSRSAPNLDVVAQEAMVCNYVSTEQMDTNSSPRNLFRVKKYNLEKNKMLKEEKLLREKFMYEKEIKVINTAVAHCSNALTKGKLDLKITAGEQLDIIDVTEGNQVLCRNSEGKYGYVLLEHLNFRH